VSNGSGRATRTGTTRDSPGTSQTRPGSEKNSGWPRVRQRQPTTRRAALRSGLARPALPKKQSPMTIIVVGLTRPWRAGLLLGRGICKKKFQIPPASIPTAIIAVGAVFANPNRNIQPTTTKPFVPSIWGRLNQKRITSDQAHGSAFSTHSYRAICLH